MKNLLKLSFILALAFMFNSCEQDDPFEDDTSDVRDRFIGDWVVVETENSVQRTYDIRIEKGTINGNRINIFNFYNLGESDSAIASISSVATQTLTLVNQELNNHFIEDGGGIYNDNNTITMTFSIDDGNSKRDVSAILSR